ncbi:helix-turn-helix domain-containing protein [Curtobacterium sp. MCBD17_028]|uniref:AraC family transcriptional regulator n=1 Tax=Curtobacterium sp. MCBD17_028 TaxID=2175670 RepID=UPI000DAA22FB|nr:helix-turn-helix domain-containing protein [Curtobacterium sp. MCBD17_028]PZE24781.1 hypothetical protein DEI86_12160 [Curtobacterium sp. MCBD17_028]
MEGTARITRERRVATSQDVEQARVLLQTTHHAVGWDVQADADGRPFGFRHTVTGTGLLSLASTRLTGMVSGELETSADEYVVAWLKEGSGSIAGLDVSEGEPVLYPTGSFPFRYDGFDKDLLHVDRSIVEEVAAERGGWAPGPLGFDHDHIPTGEARSAWWAMVRQVAVTLISGPATVTLDAERALARTAAEGLLAAFPHWPVVPATDPDGVGTAAEARVAAAERFIREHATSPIGITDVAAAAGMSMRGLQEAFNRTHGMTPTTYLRRVRLSMVRDRLLAADHRTDTVAEIAGAHGFGHKGRFAAAYAAEFGEAPNTTLRRDG